MSNDAFRAFEKNRWEAPGFVQKYKWQISVYMICMMREAMLVVKNRNNGKLLRCGIEIPFYDVEKIAERVEYIQDWVTRGILPGPCDTPSYPCPYFYLHEDDEELEHDEVIDGLAGQYQDLLAQKQRVSDKIDTIRSQINTAMGSRTKVETPTVRVVKFTSKGRTSYDADQMVLDGIDPKKYEKVGEPSERLRITLKEKGGSKDVS